MLGQMQETHDWPNVGNIGNGTNPYLIKRGLAPFQLQTMLCQSLYFQHLAKHVFPAFAQACVYVFLPKHVFMFLAQACGHVYFVFAVGNVCKWGTMERFDNTMGNLY